MTLLDHLTSQAFIDATTVTAPDGRTHDLDLCCDEHVEAIIAVVLDAARGAVAGLLDEWQTFPDTIAKVSAVIDALRVKP